jgi:hypothetical protein
MAAGCRDQPLKLIDPQIHPLLYLFLGQAQLISR